MRRSKRVVKKAVVEDSSSDDDQPISTPQIKKTTQAKCNEESSSESDIENYLQPINKIDLSSSFYNLTKKEDVNSDKNDSKTVQLSRLSDSSSDEDDSITKNTESQEEMTTNAFKTGFEHMAEFKRKMEETKKHVDLYNEKRKSQIHETSEPKKPKKEPILDLHISNLLALGEKKTQLTLDNIRKEDLHPSDFESSGEDWEEVKYKESKENKESIVPKEGIEITLGTMPENVRKKKAVDLLAAMKRRLNHIRKENQIYVHKVHLLCWIAHGNYVNNVINNSDILSQALTLLPSEKSYPSDRPELGYLEKIVQWYKKTIMLNDKPAPKKLDLMSCLQLQMTKKTAFNNKMYVLIFIAILRALGIQTRLVLSFQVEPLKPPASELHSLAKEKPENKGKKTSNKSGTSDKVENAAVASTSKSKQELTKKKINTKDNNAKSQGSQKNIKDIKPKKEKDPGGKKSTAMETTKANVKKVSQTKSSNSEPASKIEGDRTTNKRTARSSKKLEAKIPKMDEVNIPQVDGRYDSSGTSSDESTYSLVLPQVDGPSSVKKICKPNIKKLSSKKIPNENTKVKKGSKPSLSKLKSQKVNKSFNTTEDSDDEFVSGKQISQRTPSKQLDVKNDVINLIKGRIAEQKHIDRSRLATKRRKTYADSDSDSDYAPEPIKKKHQDSDSDKDDFAPKVKVKKRIRVKKEGNSLKVISSESDDESGKKKRKGINVWVEVFLEAEEKWICADVVKGQVHCVNEIYARSTHPVTYIVAWKNDNSLKDVTMRYCKNFSTVTRKLRVEQKWWEETIRPFMGKQTIRDKEEDDDLNRQQLDQPMPKAISEYKNHPLYALKRHLLKFEAIYPDDQIPLGYVRGEPVYPRNSVYVCRSRDIWLKEALVVKPGEKPYKIVKARPKYDKLSNSIVTDQLLEIFGPWQTMDYEPPTAENGVVPRNAFGNVELFKSCMLPKGTVHIRLAGLNKVCKKLNVDCASAIVGFDFHGGWSHPVYDGFVICEEFADNVIAAWELDQEEMERKEIEKIEQRVYGNWKRLIKGLLIRERLKAKYDFGQPSSQTKESKHKKSKTNRSSKKKTKSSDNGSEWEDID